MQEARFLSLIDPHKSLLILLPTNPHFDQVAAGLSLYLTLSGKKDITIACPSPMVVEFNRLVGVDKIVSELGNKNLTIKLLDYEHDRIENVKYDIENGEVKLTVIPKPTIKPPKKEQVHISYSGIAAEAVILLGGGHKDHFPALATSDLVGAKIIHIGIREIPLDREGVISLARSASSISEIVASIIKESDFAFDSDVATNLLMGIEEGSRGFSIREVSAETFFVAGELMKVGGKRIPRGQYKEERRNFPPGAIPGEQPKVNPQPQQSSTQIQNTPPAPKSWYEPKIYKGTTVS